MSEWKKFRLGELYEVKNGLSKGRQFFGSGFPFLSFSVVFNQYFIPDELEDLVQSDAKERDSFSIRKGDLFVTRTSETADELGMSCVALKDYPNAVYNGFTKRLRPIGDAVWPRYMGYCMRGPIVRNQMSSCVAMTTRASLANEDLLNIEVTIPSLDEQKKIAAVLGALDDKIENNRKICANLEAQAQALFKSWFVDFEPWGGKMPEGWKKGKLGDLALVRKDTVAPARMPEQVAHYSLPAYDKNRLPSIEQSSTIKSNKFVISENSILISKLNPSIKRLWDPAVNQSDYSVCSTEFVVIEPKGAQSRAYLYSVLDSEQFYQYAVSHAAGTTNSHQRISPDDVLAFEMNVPDVKVIVEFSKMLEPVYQTVKSAIAESRALAEMRDALLPKLMSGEIDVEKVAI